MISIKTIKPISFDKNPQVTKINDKMIQAINWIKICFFFEKFVDIWEDEEEDEIRWRYVTIALILQLIADK